MREKKEKKKKKKKKTANISIETSRRPSTPPSPHPPLLLLSSHVSRGENATRPLFAAAKMFFNRLFHRFRYQPLGGDFSRELFPPIKGQDKPAFEDRSFEKNWTEGREIVAIETRNIYIYMKYLFRHTWRKVAEAKQLACKFAETREKGLAEQWRKGVERLSSFLDPRYGRYGRASERASACLPKSVIGYMDKWVGAVARRRGSKGRRSCCSLSR